MLTMILLLLALGCFAFAAFGVNSPRVALLPLGLAFWVATLLVGR